MMTDDPPFLLVGTEVSAKYKGAFCEAKIRKVVKCVKCKILFKQGLGMASVADDTVKGTIRVGSVVEAKHPERKEFVEGTITKIQDCSQYTVVFDDGDITTLRRTALCLKSGRHFAESETLDQLPLTHPEHFSNPVIGGRRGRRRGVDSSDEEEVVVRTKTPREEKEADIGRVVCVEGDKKKQRDNWFPGLVVAPTAQDTVRIHVREEYLVRSFKDGRYYTVPKKETTEFTREIGAKVDNHGVKTAVEKALLFLDKDELPPHWDRNSLFGLNEPSNYETDHDSDSDNLDDEPREEKDHFVAQLYKFMDDRGTPINQGPKICSKDVDLYKMFYVVHDLGGCNRVTNHNHWKTVSQKLGYGQNPVNVNIVKNVYKKFLQSFEDFYRKLGCTMVSHPRTCRNRSRAGRSLIRDKDKLSVKTESKEKSDADESEDASVAGSLGNLQDVQDIKMDVEEPILEPNPIKIKLEPKEEPPVKKTVEKEKVQVKCVEEKVEEDVKVKSELVKEKPRMRQGKLKTVEPPVAIKKEEEIKEEEVEVKPPIEKKKRLFTRALMKEKMGLGKSGTGSTSVATSRQKRTIRDRVKDMVKKFKFRKDTSVSKETTVTVTTDTGDKVQNTNKEKIVKIKEEPILPKEAPPKKEKKEEPIIKEPPTTPTEEKKKVGRKKKEKKDQEEVFDSLPTYKTVCVGDKLKVYYGPTNESKVTYEAKVLNVKKDGPEIEYLVHYTGWNTRYDEYIKHARIADNLSWVPGRASKNKASSFFKTSRRKNSISKPETSGPPMAGKSDLKEYLIVNKPDGQNSNNTKTISQVDSVNNGKLVKPSTVTRSSWRNSKKEETASDNEQDDEGECPIPSLYMSDELLSDKTRSEKVKEILGINDESSLISATDKRKTKKRTGPEDNSKASDGKIEQRLSESCSNTDLSLSKIDRRKKRSQSESENQETTEKRRLITRRRRSSSTVEDKSETNLAISAESPGSSDEKKRTRKRLSALDSPDTTTQKKRRLISEKKSDLKQSDATSQQSLMNTDDESNKKPSEFETEEASKGRDFDLIQIRSELKGLDKAVKTEADSYKSATDGKTASEKKSETEKLAEDVYEFKEPEPFEFEVCKSSEDKGKSLQRRTLGRLFDDLKKQPSVLIPSTFYKGKKESKTEELRKSFFDSNFEEDITIKNSPSPSRQIEENISKPFQLFTDLPEVENEDENKKSESLNIPYSIDKSDQLDNAGSKSEEEPLSLPSLSPKSPVQTEMEVNENSNVDSNEVESTSKSCFSRDDDEDESEDESINIAIQRAIKQEISDDDDDDDDTRPRTNLVTVDSNIFFCQEKIPDEPVTVQTINHPESDDPETSTILIPSDKIDLEDKCVEDGQSSEGTTSETEFDLDQISGVKDEDDEDEEDCKDDSFSIEHSTEATMVSSPVIISTADEADNIMIADEDLVSTSSLITPIVVSAHTKETLEFSTNGVEVEHITQTYFTVSGSPSEIKSSEDPIMEPIAANIQVETNMSDPSDTEIDTSNLEIQEESVKVESDTEFTFKPITVPPPDESESTISIPFTDSKSADEIIINLEPEKMSNRMNPEDSERTNDQASLAKDLMCEETIPGSPSSPPELGEDDQEKLESATVETIEVKVERIEEIMGQPITEEIVQSEEIQTVSEITPRSSPSTSPVREASSMSPQPPSSRSYPPTVDDSLFADIKESDEELKLEKTPSKQETLRKISSPTKRQKPVKKRIVETGRRRNSRRHAGSDSDDTSENSSGAITYNRSGHSFSISSDIKETTSTDGTRSSKYNFLVSLEPWMDQNTRINLIQNSIQQIRKVYADLKSELAIIDRRRKKLRKRERENLAAFRMH